MDRRQFLSLAATTLLHADTPTHHAPKAKRVIQLFMSGAASQCDLWDYKPLLDQKAGQPWDPGEKVELFQSKPGLVMNSPFGWLNATSTGKPISKLLPHTARQLHHIAFLHSLQSKSNVHGPATFMQNTGFILPGFPSMGAWISYALGSANNNLPTLVVLPDPRGYPPNGPANWSSGFLPAAHQATIVRAAAKHPIADLQPPAQSTPANEADTLKTLQTLNRTHLQTHPGDSRLDARIASYEMAARLQLSAPEVLDIASESPATRDLYGLDNPVTSDFARRCLIARRLIQRGVRFVQVWSGADNGFPRRNWDSHENLAKDHAELATSIDQPMAALLHDLHTLGLLEDTIVHWSTEFGRMPCSQGSLGRDHNPFGFTQWLAGGGIKGGTTYGATDEWSYKAVEHPIHCYDLHATVLHLLGFDHTRLSFRHNGIDRRLTDVHGHVIPGILA
jgi:hypothetical protein